MSVLFGTALTADDKKALNWAKQHMPKDGQSNPQEDTVTAVPVNESDILKRVTVLEAKSIDKNKLDSKARVRIKEILEAKIKTASEENKKSRLRMKEDLKKKW